MSNEDYWAEKNLDGHDENGVGYRLDKYGRKCYKPTEQWRQPKPQGNGMPRKPKPVNPESNPEEGK